VCLLSDGPLYPILVKILPFLDKTYKRSIETSSTLLRNRYVTLSEVSRSIWHLTPRIRQERDDQEDRNVLQT